MGLMRGMVSNRLKVDPKGLAHWPCFSTRAGQFFSALAMLSGRSLLKAENLLIEIEVEFAVSNLPSADVHWEEGVDRGSVGAKPATLRCVGGRLGLKLFPVLLAGKQVGGALIFGGDARITVDRF